MKKSLFLHSKYINWTLVAMETETRYIFSQKIRNQTYIARLTVTRYQSITHEWFSTLSTSIIVILFPWDLHSWQAATNYKLADTPILLGCVNILNLFAHRTFFTASPASLKETSFVNTTVVSYFAIKAILCTLIILTRTDGNYCF